MEELIRQIFAQARLLGACQRFKGTEQTLEEIIGVFKTNQGLEFCLKHNFPNLATFRQFKPFDPSRYGIYIDAGNITLKNPQKVILIGRTTATLNYDTLERHEVYLLHSARAVVNAYKWAVVSVEQAQGTQVVRNISGNAVIL